MHRVISGGLFVLAFSAGAYSQDVNPSLKASCEREFQERVQAGLRKPSDMDKFMAACYERAKAASKAKQRAQPKVVESTGRPNGQEIMQCVDKWFHRRLQVGPSVLVCDEFVQLENVEVADKREQAGQTDLIVDINLRALQEFGGQSLVATTCTSTGWNGEIPVGARITIKKVLSFQVFSSQSICLNQTLEPIAGGNWSQ